VADDDSAPAGLVLPAAAQEEFLPRTLPDRPGDAMDDADAVRRIALSLPGAVEVDSEGFDFRVGGKGFVWSYPERRPGRAAGDPDRRRRPVRR
jgi:hypothetical protein